ncbi:MAG: hypothetical protein DMF56_15345 [Acidobacteria bacterium]|nr:MAG: hypothetical protein DMF56_15345 [Acidobacteriota bacterium]
MKRAVLLLLLATLPALAQTATCTNKIQGLSETQVTAVICSGTANPVEGQPMLIGVGGSQFETNVKKVTSVFGFTVVDAAVVDRTKAQENLELLSGAQNATLQYQTTNVTVSVIPADPLTVLNQTKYNWSVGPAKAPNTDPNNPTTDATNLDAIRFQGSGGYLRGGVFGRKAATRTRLQSTATISIDTTDADSTAFADTNRAAAGVQMTNFNAGRLWMHGSAGIELQTDRAFHSDSHDVNAVFKVAGWIPLIRSFTLFSTQGSFIAAPLSFTASYGYSNQHSESASSAGRKFEGTALYHLFLFDDYQVSFSGTWTVNDLNNRATNIPRTQKMYKVNIAYMADNKRGFYGVASFEDGSAGAMFKDVRQYFVGVGLARLNLGGKGGS